ncbi:MAG: hypothetical protein MR241_06165 [Firmicutes bacterium]|uniref:Uncharacterized protein n=1 Tax=Candidatus Colimorpha enterica TaxID=3083063 RepID=A0AAE3K1R6_9BACT|nr:hypothetical protein [Candidatus Colimorpha enterica]MCI5755864.1 hypothetical protein [Candidatus Colimorpha enterica]
MENEKKLKRRRVRLDLVAQIKKNKAVFAVYIVLRLIVIVSLVFALVRGNFENAVLCVATLLLLLAPSFIEKSFSVELPSVLEIIIMCFAFSHAILGEIGCFYVKVPWWDTMLHTLNGFLCAGVGFSLIDLLNRDKRFRFELSPVYVALVAFCFSMTVGVLWEFFEFGSDMIFKTDMQKDTVIRSITSVALDPTKSNTPVTVDGITSVVVNGRELGVGGYLDIGLIDTMKDLIVNFIGAVVFSIFGFIYIKYRGRKSRVVENFMVTVRKEEEKSDE